jgi:hypothetical protein
MTTIENRIKEEIQNKCELELGDKSNAYGELFYGDAFEIFKKYLDIVEEHAKSEMEKREQEIKDKIINIGKTWQIAEESDDEDFEYVDFIDTALYQELKQQIFNIQENKSDNNRTNCIHEKCSEQSPTGLLEQENKNLKDKQTETGSPVKFKGCRIKQGEFIYSRINTSIELHCGDIIWDEVNNTKKRLLCSSCQHEEDESKQAMQESLK